MHIVAVINSLLFAGLALALLHTVGAEMWETGAWTVVALGVAFKTQVTYINHREDAGRRVLYADKVNRSGGIVFRRANEGVEYLLVSPKESASAEWLFPKGKIKCGEGPVEAALREVEEEAGVKARSLCAVGTTCFSIDGERNVVRYYLMEYVSPGSPKEHRAYLWLDLEQASIMLAHRENEFLLRLAERLRSVHESVGNRD
ncbi:MAG: NUDIX domain-containing protein [Candidatus Hydrogenedentales bacterium]